MKIFVSFVFLLTFFVSLMSQAQGFVADENFRIVKTQWEASDEQNFSAFIQKMGSSKCKTVDSCFRSEEANLYFGSEISTRRFMADCAFLPYLLRLYFAWKNGLPFAYNHTAKPIVPAAVKPEEMPKKWDPRYSRWGNSYAGRRTVWPATSGEDRAFEKEMNQMRGSVSTANLRHHPELSKPTLPDFYSADISPKAIRPGTIIYDPNGHVSVVYEVTPEGRVKFFEAHPDNTVSRGSYSRKYVRASLNAGAGFKNFRPFIVAGAQRDLKGFLVGGNALLLENSQISQYSILQYVGTHPDPNLWSQGKFFFEKREVDYYKFVQLRLAEKNFRLNPVVEFEDILRELCDDVKERIQAVDGAIQRQIYLKPHPANLPYNIYGAEGEWEEFSSPGRDVRLRAGFHDLMIKVREYFDLITKKDPSLHYTGPNLKRDLLKAFQKVNYSCQVAYRNSKSEKIQLSLEHVMSRLYDISFSPYHCPERRWGARFAYELRTCSDDPEKVRWYEAMKGLRTFILRDASQVMGWSVVDLEKQVPGSFPADKKVPDLNVKSFLESLPN